MVGLSMFRQGDGVCRKLGVDNSVKEKTRDA